MPHKTEFENTPDLYLKGPSDPDQAKGDLTSSFKISKGTLDSQSCTQVPSWFAANFQSKYWVDSPDFLPMHCPPVWPGWDPAQVGDTNTKVVVCDWWAHQKWWLPLLLQEQCWWILDGFSLSKRLQCETFYAVSRSSPHFLLFFQSSVFHSGKIPLREDCSRPFLRTWIDDDEPAFVPLPSTHVREVEGWTKSRRWSNRLDVILEVHQFRCPTINRRNCMLWVRVWANIVHSGRKPTPPGNLRGWCGSFKFEGTTAAEAEEKPDFDPGIPEWTVQIFLKISLLLLQSIGPCRCKRILFNKRTLTNETWCFGLSRTWK